MEYILDGDIRILRVFVVVKHCVWTQPSHSFHLHSSRSLLPWRKFRPVRRATRLIRIACLVLAWMSTAEPENIFLQTLSTSPRVEWRCRLCGFLWTRRTLEFATVKKGYASRCHT